MPGLSARQRLELRVARWAAHLRPRTQVRLAGGRPTRRDGLTLEPQVQLALWLAERQGAPRVEELPPPQGRALTRRQSAVGAGPPPPVGAVTDLQVDGAAGPLRARHYAPEPDPATPGPRPLLVFLHGGGFVIGDLETHDVVCRMLCRGAATHVLAVDYRLAPEHPFPAAPDDAVAAFGWAAANAGRLGADPGRVWVGGDSAGGNLAACVAFSAARHGTPAPALQLLLYPTVDRSREWPSQTLFDDGFFLTRPQMDWFEAQYLPHETDDPRTRLVRAPELGGQAPALVVTAGFDPLRDEGEAYAAALREAGVPAVLRRFPGLIHGFANMTGVIPVARDAVAEVAGMARVLLETAPVSAAAG
jgi:acetyl esterase